MGAVIMEVVAIILDLAASSGVGFWWLFLIGLFLLILYAILKIGLAAKKAHDSFQGWRLIWSEPARWFKAWVGSVPKLAPGDIRLIEDSLNGIAQRDGTERIKIAGQVNRLSGVRMIGEHLLSPEVQKQAEAIRSQWLKNGQINDPHAVIVNDPFQDLTNVVFECETLDYPSVKALREAPNKPRILSTCVLALCDKKREVYLQRRSVAVEIAKDKVHTIGGAFMPAYKALYKKQTWVDRDLIDCARREFYEETNIALQGVQLERVPMVLMEELGTGFVHVVFLGVNISPDQAKDEKPNWEAIPKDIRTQDKKLHGIQYEKLEKMLYDQTDWVLSGKAHVLMWLSMGAPGSKSGRWRGKKPTEIFLDYKGKFSHS
jgi:hypothetical protein